MIVAPGSGARKRNTLLAAKRKIVAALGVESLDVFFAEYVHPGDNSDAVLGEGGALDILQEWKSEGLIRYVGASAHDRPLAQRLAEDHRVDVLMHRFNMAHRKAESNVFPAAQETKTPVVAFTATRWRTLLEGRDDWSGAAPTAADCYRFCLSHPAVKLALSAPLGIDELEANLPALDEPTMTRRERTHWERFGDLVYGDGNHRFETEWP
jgi:predicted aldo/keto reductase-like oxidoreductase